MRDKTGFLCCLVLVFLINACTSGQGRKSTLFKGIKPLETGKVIQDVICIKDQAVSYAVYLPKDYTEEKRFPVILAFDPHASGQLPVEKYQSLAERYHTILIGSNNSRNGLQMDETENIISSMFEEINLRFSMDTSRIYVMGFSGGARVASLIALYHGGVRGLIGCGAGFANSDQPARYRFDYIGFAGNADFNMNEMISLDEQLEEVKFRHALVIFDGKHEWPPAEVMEYAFMWNRFCLLKDNKTMAEHTYVADFMAKISESIKKAEGEKSPYQKSLALQLVIRFLQDLEPVDNEKKELAQLQAGEAYKKEKQKIDAIHGTEMREQRMFMENFYFKDLTWWKKKITNYELRITKGNDKEEVLMYKRIMSYLSLLAYMNYSNTLNSGAKEKAEFAMQVYRIVDPENAAKIK